MPHNAHVGLLLVQEPSQIQLLFSFASPPVGNMIQKHPNFGLEVSKCFVFQNSASCAFCYSCIMRCMIPKGFQLPLPLEQGIVFGDDNIFSFRVCFNNCSVIIPCACFTRRLNKDGNMCF